MLKWPRTRPRSLCPTRLSGFAFPHRQPSVRNVGQIAKNHQHGEQEQRHQVAPPSKRNGKLSLFPDPSIPPAKGCFGQQESSRATRTRRLLRALLRECTYLPDPAARAWTSQHILTRFRAYNFEAWKQDNLKEPHLRDREAWEARLRTKEKEARSWLAYLHRANQGERKCLLRLLLMTYGRIGKRRHELMRPLLAEMPEEMAGTMVDGLERRGATKEEEMDVLPERSSNARGSAARDATLKPSNLNTATPTLTLTPNPQLTPQLHTLITSQISQPPPTLTRPNPRRLTLEFPSLNTWLQRMPQRRIRNKRKAHRASLLSKTLPPLPAKEFQRLLALASGKESIPSPPSRRIPANVSDTAAYGRSGSSALESVVAYGKLPAHRVRDNRDAHAITPRFMRRLYAEVVRQCAVMEGTNEQGKAWSITWGGKALEEMKFARVGGG